MTRSWSSIDKEESLACQITSPFNNKLGCFKNKIKKIGFQKQPIFNLKTSMTRFFVNIWPFQRLKFAHKMQLS